MNAPTMALGTMHFATRVDEKTAFAVLDRYAELGGVWLDTSNNYSSWTSDTGFGGQSEALPGRWLAANPGAGVRLSTKVGARPTRVGGFPDHLEGLREDVVRHALAVPELHLEAWRSPIVVSVTSTAERLQWEVGELVGFYKLLDEGQLHVGVYPGWDVLDVLRHLVWWHESFAAIVQAAAEGKDGAAPKGSLAEVNARSVSSLERVGLGALLRRLALAQRQLERNGDLPPEQMLGYRRGSRRYAFEERTQISIGELSRHRRDVLRAVLAADCGTRGGDDNAPPA